MSVDQDVADFERSASRLIVVYREAVARICSAVGITPTQLHCLGALADLGATKMTVLAHRLELSAGATSTMVDRMVDGGLIVRRPDDADRRVIYVQLSERGAAVLARARAEKRTVIADVFRRLSPSQRRQLTIGLAALATAWAGPSAPVQAP